MHNPPVLLETHIFTCRTLIRDPICAASTTIPRTLTPPKCTDQQVNPAYHRQEVLRSNLAYHRQEVLRSNLAYHRQEVL